MALDIYKAGTDIRKAAERGCRKAARLIFFRKCLDALSAAVYMLTLDMKAFKAVMRAHKEYRNLAEVPSAGAIHEYLVNHGTEADVKGRYTGWIVLDSMLNGDKVFEKTRIGL